MATLEAVVSVHDNASSKFTTMKASAKRFEMQLESINRELDKIAIKLTALTARRWVIRLDVDRSGLPGRASSINPVAMNPNAHFLEGQFAQPGGELPYDISDGQGGPQGISRAAAPLANEKGRAVRRRFGSGFGGLGSSGGTFRFITRGLLPLVTRSGAGIGGFLGELVGRTLGQIIGKSRELTGSLKTLAKAFRLVGAGAGAFAALSGSLMTIIAGLAQGIGVLVGLIWSLGAPLAAIFPLLVGLGAAIGAVALPMAYLFTQTKNLVDEKEKLTEELNKLTPGTEEYNAKLKELKETQDKLDKFGTEKVWMRAKKFVEEAKSQIFNERNGRLFVDVFDNMLHNAKNVLPLFSKSVGDFATVFRNLFAQMGAFTSSSGFKDWWGRVFGANTQALVYDMGAALGRIVMAFGDLGAAVAPAASTMMQDLAGWAKGLSERLTSKDSDLGKWVSDVYPIFKRIVEVLGGLIKYIGNFIAQPHVKEFILMFVNWFYDIGRELVDFISRMILEYGDYVRYFLKVLGKAIRAVFVLIEMGMKVAEPFLRILFRIVELVADFILTIANADDPWEALFVSLFGWLSPVKDFFNQLIGYFKTAWEWVNKFNPFYYLMKGGRWLSEKLGQSNSGDAEYGYSGIGPGGRPIASDGKGGNIIINGDQIINGPQDPAAIAAASKRRSANSPSGGSSAGGYRPAYP